jgi:hypothetical protein
MMTSEEIIARLLEIYELVNQDGHVYKGPVMRVTGDLIRDLRKEASSTTAACMPTQEGK